ncbi:MAG TPA: Bax inhibitor-1/YccA family protein [Gemmatimonadaceae bacterium]|jgi:FtsH-binding integral membrane protein|nr:Bax inhibitor-1/YccA family protein [Gemmatimonadaceae bacterium]
MGFSRYEYAPPTSGTLVRTGEERATLVRRVYALLFTGILVTIAGALFAVSNQAVLTSVLQHPFIMIILMFGTLFAVRGASRSFPANIGLLYLFNLIMGVWIAPVLLFYAKAQPGVLAQAGIMTATAFGALTLYAFVSRRDFSAWGSFFFVGLIVLVVASLLNIFFHSNSLQTVIAAVGVFIFSGLLVFDTWRIRNTFAPDDYIPAALNLYLDVLNLFLFILQLLGGGRRRG